MSKEKKKSTLVEQHALKRLEKVEENQRKAYEKKKDDFYMSTDPLVLTGVTSMCKECAKKIAMNYDERTGEYGDCTKASIQAALCRLDKPYIEDLYVSSYVQANDMSNNSNHRDCLLYTSDAADD